MGPAGSTSSTCVTGLTDSVTIIYLATECSPVPCDSTAPRNSSPCTSRSATRWR